MMARTFNALGALLTYPRPELLQALGEIQAVIEAERLVPRRERDTLRALCTWLSSGDPWDLQEDYVDTFDRGRGTSLNLFEHVHGESRERGQAMVDLHAMYAACGLEPAAHELPDFLPLYLEFASTRPVDEARALIGEIEHILRMLGESLLRRESPYAAVIAALLAAAGEARLDGDPLELIRRSRAGRRPGDASDFEAVDAEWLDAPVTFGGCDAAAQAAAQAPLRFVPRAARTA